MDTPVKLTEHKWFKQQCTDSQYNREPPYRNNSKSNKLFYIISLSDLSQCVQ